MTTMIGQATMPGAPSGRMTVAEYEDLIARGILTKRSRVELIEGRIVGKMSKGPQHSIASKKVQNAIASALGPNPAWTVWAENPVALPGRQSEPEPDVSVARGEPDDYADGQPGPADVALVVEVADSSLADDRALVDMYVGAGIPTYWIVDVAGRSLEVHTASGREILAEGESAELVLDGAVVARIAVADLLPRRTK